MLYPQAPPTLQGMSLPSVPESWPLGSLEITQSPNQWVEAPISPGVVERLADQSTVETVPRVEPGRPCVRTRWQWAAPWSFLNSQWRQTVERVVAMPGTVRFTLWRSYTVPYIAQAGRSQYFLPSGWVYGDWVHNPQAAQHPATSQPIAEIRIGTPNAEPIQLQVVEAAVYNAGEPAPGEAWLRHHPMPPHGAEGIEQPFKLGTPAPDAAPFWLDITPVFTVRTSSPGSRTVNNPRPAQPFNLLVEEA